MDYGIVIVVLGARDNFLRQRDNVPMLGSWHVSVTHRESIYTVERTTVVNLIDAGGGDPLCTLYQAEHRIKGIRIWHCMFAASIILCSTPT